MTRPYTIACVQNSAVAEVDRNIAIVSRLTRAAIERGAEIVCLPEYFSGVELKGGLLHPAAFEENRHPVLQAFSDLARERRTWLLLGSLGVLAGDGRTFNRGYLLDPTGSVAARYDKIHLFDVELTQGAPLRESATIAPGDCAVMADTGFCRMGLSICYDLRFPQLYRRLAQAGADVLGVPAAFTKVTGEAHWHVLNRARAVENGCYVVAPCQFGTLPGGADCFGHSLIIDPWGRVLADGGESEGIIGSACDPAEVAKARARIPALGHDREFASPGKTGRSTP
ncbi:carbon-nitrogen hydrolase family protein [Dongia deserti]|uniref:carbon-nitrogen hydrolase family protein n=1 Tax=Dongia deserti TaxID=2268030 RepID=UPI000E647CFE|nr:carbon-nitrogen hydrolase family protein [Dongia deserti]